MVREIISHKAPRHADDSLAILLAKEKYPEAEVKYIHPQDQSLEALRENPQVMLVDVGQDYNVAKKNYDHHQDTSLPSSLVLVLRDEIGIDPSQLPEKLRKAIETIDRIDREGFPKVAKEEGIKATDMGRIIQGVVLSAINDHPNPKELFVEDKPVLEILKEAVEEPMTPQTADLISKLVSEGQLKYENIEHPYVQIWEGLLGRIKREIVEPKINEEIRKRKEILEAIRNAVEVDEGVYVITKAIPAGEFFKRNPDAKLLITPNAMNPNHTSIVKNTANPATAEIDLKKIYEEVPALAGREVFTHKAGFITVVDMPLEEVVEALYPGKKRNRKPGR